MIEYQDGIKDTMTNFEKCDKDRRFKKVKVVGNVLTAAAEMSEIIQEADEFDESY
ncbi:MAG: hypothetical protein JKY42_02515, partial [Flavobacteriales bacterium]|nr:hypothetical protein [Flavobacteriales bacterium]